jgi:signal transduction histidine kinase/phage shock protein PspC (stress-responsive transcriptional regulator)
VLGGVCTAVARHLGWSVGTTRWVAVALTCCGGAGGLLYLWLWALTPLEPGADGVPDRMHRTVAVPWVLFAAAAACAVAVLGGGWLLATGGSAGTLSMLILVMVVCAVGAVGWDQLIDAAPPPRVDRGAAVMRVLAGGVLVAVSVLAPTIWGARATGFAWALFGVTLLAGVAVLAGPWALRLWKELIAERTARVREEQRAEIAAHLHDSVLQTLALIQTRAGASSEVARIARAQERELREWLYAGSGTVDSDLATDLRDFAAALELDFAVRIEVVTVGETPERSGGEIAAAAREAMLNAARHAGGDVSVYIEGAPAVVDVFVRDRGPGFSIECVPEDRLGVRESILGRMRRAGGTATVGPGAGAGTEVHLHLERGEGTSA